MGERPMQAWLARVDGGPRPGQPALLVGDAGVGKSAILVHVGLEALRGEGRVLHVTLRETVGQVRAFYDDAGRGLGVLPSESVSLERRRMILSYVDRAFDPVHLESQARMLRDIAAFEADVLLLDGLTSAAWLAHGEALGHLSQALGLSLWVTVASEGGVIRSGGTARVVVRVLDSAEGGLRLSVDGHEETLPFRLDATAQQVVPTEAGSAAPPNKPLRASDVTLFAGGAPGAEAAFGESAAAAGCAEVHFTFEGHVQARVVGQRLLTPAELEVGDVSIVYVSRRLNRQYNETGLIRRVLQTLWHMVSRSDQVFVVGQIQEDGTVVGGTGWAVELARMMWSKELWVFDQARDGWFRWSGQAWQPGAPRITSASVCGTGTRELTPAGRAAIASLFADSFGELGG